MTILTKDEFVQAVREAIVDNFGSEEAFFTAWNNNIDALEALDAADEADAIAYGEKQ